jgi:hypothetical protein
MALSYLLNPDGTSVVFKKIGSLKAAMEAAPKSFKVTKKADLEDVPLKVLVALNNRVAGIVEEVETVKRFPSKEEAIPVVFPFLRKHSDEGKEVEGGGRGRPSSFRGKKITRNVAENPRRKDTHGWRAWELIKDGMTFERGCCLATRISPGRGYSAISSGRVRPRLFHSSRARKGKRFNPK